MSKLKESISQAMDNLPTIFMYTGSDGVEYPEDPNLKDIDHLADTIRDVCKLDIEGTASDQSISKQQAVEIVELVEKELLSHPAVKPILRDPLISDLHAIRVKDDDQLDRSILIELMRIPRDRRKLESQILSEFEQIKPKVLGYILDVLVKALQIKPNLRLNELPRMADFALWGEAISQAMGNKPLVFLNAYYENIGRQNIEAIEANPLGQAIAKFCNGLENKSWEGSHLVRCLLG